MCPVQFKQRVRKYTDVLEDVQLGSTRAHRTIDKNDCIPPRAVKVASLIEEKIQAFLYISLNDGLPIRHTLDMGYIPIMVKSHFCHLHGPSPSKMHSKA
ncbi:hypothetical protein HMI56_005851 [Coelomomyces lativittatus]|nr:hypothetical protein HMI56_005851 [Coelomomyces lativittatus]